MEGTTRSPQRGREQAGRWPRARAGGCDIAEAVCSRGRSLTQPHGEAGFFLSPE